MFKFFDLRRASLTLKLAVFFTLATALILMTVSGILYRALKEQLHDQDRNELALATLQLGESVRYLAREQNSENWLREWNTRSRQNRRLALRVFTPDQEIYVATEMNIPLAAFPPAKTPLETVRWQGAKDQKNVESAENAGDFLLTNLAIEVAPTRWWRIEAALDLTQSNQLLRTYWQQLSVLLSVSLLITAGIGTFIAWYSLRPLAKISAQMRQISSEKLATRIGHKAWPFELLSVSQAFDAMLARIEDSFTQLSRFSADLAHEVRTPVNNLIAAASVTLIRPRKTAEYEEALAAVITEGQQLAAIVDSMLFLARAEHKSEVLRIENLAAQEELTRQIDYFEALANEKEVVFKRVTEENKAHANVFVNADPLLLRRALSNLIHNAILHTPSGGKVCLRAFAEKNAVCFAVEDSGSGILPEHLPHIFERFYRAEASRSERARSGLGLSIAKSIAQLHGGDLEVTSIIGQGSTFTLRFSSLTQK